eukprot:COSAG05_NODE_249_length_12903_cov_128.635505_11_plen_150_part_00
MAVVVASPAPTPGASTSMVMVVAFPGFKFRFASAWPNGGIGVPSRTVAATESSSSTTCTSATRAAGEPARAKGARIIWACGRLFIDANRELTRPHRFAAAIEAFGEFGGAKWPRGGAVPTRAARAAARARAKCLIMSDHHQALYYYIVV